MDERALRLGFHSIRLIGAIALFLKLRTILHYKELYYMWMINVTFIFR